MKFQPILKEMLRLKAYDLHLRVGSPPVFRIMGELSPMERGAMSQEEMLELATKLMNDRQRDIFNKNHEVDFSVGIAGLGRIRVNMYKQRGTISAAIRLVPIEIPKLDDLELPVEIKNLAELTRGLVIVSGASGSGKSTTLAAILNHINQHRRVNILTI
jgi:twitching motility protein PilT